MNKIIISHIMFLGLPFISCGQNSNSVKLEGNLNMSEQINFRDSRAINNFYLNGNTTLKINKYSLPFSFNYTNRKVSIAHPFNRFSISPSVGKIQLSLGYSSVSSSHKTYQGLSYLGVGAIIPFDKWEINYFGGRTIKNTLIDNVSNSWTPNRYATGFEVKYSDTNSKFNISGILSQDNAAVVDQIYQALTNNLAMGFDIHQNITKKIQLKAAISASHMKNKANYESLNINPYTQYLAYSTGVYHTLSVFTYGITYDHVDPGYETHGLYFINSDLENLTATLNAGLFEKKLNIVSKAGIQRNDVNNQKSTQRNQFAGLLNLNAQISKFLFFQGSFTNIKSVGYFKIESLENPDLFYDSLQFSQVSRSGNASIRYNLKAKTGKSSISINATNQSVFNKNVNTTFSTANVNYSLRTDNNLNANFGVNTNFREGELNYGPTISFNKNLEKVSISFHVATQIMDSKLARISTRLGLNYKINESMNSSLSLMNSSFTGSHSIFFNANLFFRLK